MADNNNLQQEVAFPQRDLQIHSISSYTLDLDANKHTSLEASENQADYMNFIHGIVHEISIQGGRQFIFNSIHTEVVNIVSQIVKGDIDFREVEAIADRLLRIEVEAQEKISKLGKQLHEGLLIISHITDRNIEKIIICKAETLSYIERKTFTQQDGFPLKKKIFKSVQIIFDNDKNIQDIYVNDINESISKYWWDSFLELAKKYEDEENTKKAFTIIESKILNAIRKESNIDFWNLRNTTIHYFRSNEEFEMQDYIDKCLNGYVPEKEGLDIDKYINRAKELPAKFAFDPQFSLVKKAITAKIKRTITLHESIDLVLKGEVNPGTIESARNDRQEKGIFIKTSTGFEEFGG
ncbi:hypothetical protein HHL23_18955 [Chryseobacterium sp. RP-3-3]|uniref:37-kD nucleoid-associated bacterial protein n=1 Tax=Chryseobacterium antibioticum TaxID=2728847 RepID=A0A7Y0AQV9_9FLAO|nr:hypothetical protein [Chryseobacterium antibioticum]NML71859.1 hypothetical protein [Chryseobacterium antibioticum]